MLPQTSQTVGQCIGIESLIAFFQRKIRIFPVGFFHPLHPIERVIQYLPASGYKCLILTLPEGRISSVLFIKTMIVINEVYRPVTAVFFYFTHDASYAVSVIRIIFFVESNSIIGHRYQAPRLRDIKTYPLVHNGKKVFGNHARTGFLRISVRNAVWRKKYIRIRPVIPVLGSHQKGL